MIITFCFTIKLKNAINLVNQYKKIIEKAVSCALEHHPVRFYTDEETLSYLDISGAEIKLIDTSGFYFVDDFKVHMLSIIGEDEVLIDTDLFLFSPLHLESGYDAYFDFMDNSQKKWYVEHYDWLIDDGIRELLPEFNTKVIGVPNIGILKIPNQELKERYIELYYKIRKWVLSKYPDVGLGVSIVLGQYLLALLINEYNISCCSNNRNHYAHLGGPNKFKTNVIEQIEPTKKSKLI